MIDTGLELKKGAARRVTNVLVTKDMRARMYTGIAIAWSDEAKEYYRVRWTGRLDADGARQAPCARHIVRISMADAWKLTKHYGLSKKA